MQSFNVCPVRPQTDFAVKKAHESVSGLLLKCDLSLERTICTSVSPALRLPFGAQGLRLDDHCGCCLKRRARNSLVARSKLRRIPVDGTTHGCSSLSIFSSRRRRARGTAYSSGHALDTTWIRIGHPRLRSCDTISIYAAVMESQALHLRTLRLCRTCKVL